MIKWNQLLNKYQFKIKIKYKNRIKSLENKSKLNNR